MGGMEMAAAALDQHRPEKPQDPEQPGRIALDPAPHPVDPEAEPPLGLHRDAEALGAERPGRLYERFVHLVRSLLHLRQRFLN